MILNLEKKNLIKKVAVIGGGAAGYFAALRHKSLFPNDEVLIFEKSNKVLSKVKISGGGRCNVTHSVFNPRDLIKFYPRGSKELMSPFSKFQPGDTIQWFSERGVDLKVEEDGRMFPVTDSSQTIIDCFENERIKSGVKIKCGYGLYKIHPLDNGFDIYFNNGESDHVNKLIISTGSSESMWQTVRSLGHSIINPVPSLFTFNIDDPRLKGYEGISWPAVEIKLLNSSISATGPLLITHWGLSGPAVLKMSSWAARDLSDLGYKTQIHINFLFPSSLFEVIESFKENKYQFPNKLISSIIPPGFTQRVWSGWLKTWGYDSAIFQSLSNKQILFIAEKLTKAGFTVQGKSTFKEEFVTCGGISLKEIDMKTLQSKLIPNLYFAGEILDIDALTGGFNFQAAWTTGWIAGSQPCQHQSID